MIVSYNWLQKYFENKLPPPKEVSDTLIFHAFEVESIEPQGEDYVFDVKILPDRAHDCLAHRGIARELAKHQKLKCKDQQSAIQFKIEESEGKLHINVEEPLLCRRYAGRIIENVVVTITPSGIGKYLRAIGQKSINNIVDAANYVMFDIGQPLHVFDAAKVTGIIAIRKARVGERIVTLDGNEIELDTETLIIADDKGPLAIAGIKGGKRAEITEETTSIIIEAANFDPVSIRKTSRRLGMQTDSSKRFENERSPEGVLEAIDALTGLIRDIASGERTLYGDVVDIYPRKPNPYILGVSAEEVNNVLGTTLSLSDISTLLVRASFEHRVVKNPLGEVCGGASALIDIPYKLGASITHDAPHAFDCSSFTAYLFAQAGVQIPRMAVDQFVFGEPVQETNMEPGDLVFSNTKNGKIHYESIEWLKGTEVSSGVDHCGIYLGHGNVIHATRVTGKVVMEKLTESAQFKNIVGIRRINVSVPRLRVVVPSDRLDIRIKEDLIEDIGRILGYENIKPRKLSLEKKNTPVNKEFYYVNKIRNILVSEGFSEVYTSSFQENGKVAVENPIASDKSFLRYSLDSGVVKSMELNGKNAPLLGVDVVKLFEIGTIFPNLNKEQISLAIGIYIYHGSQNRDATRKHILDSVKSTLFQALKIDREEKFIKQTSDILHINVSSLITVLPEVGSYGDSFDTPVRETVYKKISPYPFVLRDIAVFVPPQNTEEDIVKIIEQNSGPLLIRAPKLFDRFEKKNKETGEVEKVSYAFRLVFQSHERTLSDDEVNAIMDKITLALNKNAGWHVR